MAAGQGEGVDHAGGSFGGRGHEPGSERSAMLRNSIPGTLRLIRRQVSIGMP
jgi:hypothetical protein